MTAAQHVVAYTDFSGGEYGDMPVHEARARGNMWHGINVRRYKDGRLGPRPGLKSLGISSVANGVLIGLGDTQGTTTSATSLWWIQGAKFYIARDGAGAAIAGSVDLDATPAAFVRGKVSTRDLTSKLYITCSGDKGYEIDYAANPPVPTDLPTNAAGEDIELYGERLVVGGTAANRYRLRYSNAATFSTWDAANYLDVGYGGAIRFVFAQRGGLTILKSDFMYRVQGTLGGSNVLRQVSRALPLPYPTPTEGAIIDGDDLIYYIPRDRRAPVTFDGTTADDKSLEHLDWSDQSQSSMGAYSPVNRDIVFISGEDADCLARLRDAWSFHQFGVTPRAITRFADDKFVLATAGAAGSAPVFYWFDTSLERPAFTSDGTASPGDGSSTPHATCEFELPEYVHPDGSECRVVSVVVEFLNYSTGSGTANTFTVNVTTTRQEGTAGETAATAQTWTEAGTPGNNLVRYEAFFNANHGHGFKVKLSAIKGVAIDRIEVRTEIEDSAQS